MQTNTADASNSQQKPQNWRSKNQINKQAQSTYYYRGQSGCFSA